MKYLRAMNERHQVTLPRHILREAGISEGAYFSIRAEGRRILLEPQELPQAGLKEEDWALLDDFVRRQVRNKALTRYRNPREAAKHLDRFR